MELFGCKYSTFKPWAMSTQNGYYRGGRSKLESLFSVEQNLKMITRFENKDNIRFRYL